MKKVLSLVLSLCLLLSTIAGVTIFAEDVVVNGITFSSDSSKMVVKVEAYDHFTDYYSIDDEEFVEDPTPVKRSYPYTHSYLFSYVLFIYVRH